MVARRRTNRRYYKRAYGNLRNRIARRHNMSRNNSMLSRNRILPIVLPNKYTCRLRYVTKFTLTPEVNDVSVCKVFRANDLYDPDYSVGGHQPLGFDQLATLYDHFVVVGSKIRVSPVQLTTSSGYPNFWGVALSDTNSSFTGKGFEEIKEQENCSKFKQINLVNNLNDPHGRASKMYFSQKKFFNLPKSSFDDVYQCSASGSPTELAYFVIWCNSTVSGYFTPSNFIAEIEFIVRCKEPKYLSSS